MRDVLSLLHASEALRARLISSGILDGSAYVVIAGPANTYGHYVATREEYAIQRYEGASTIFGPGRLISFFCAHVSRADPQHPATLEAYIDRYGALVPYLADRPPGSPAWSDPPPPEQTSAAISLQVCCHCCFILFFSFIYHSLTYFVDAGHCRQRWFEQLWGRLDRCAQHDVFCWKHCHGTIRRCQSEGERPCSCVRT